MKPFVRTLGFVVFFFAIYYVLDAFYFKDLRTQIDSYLNQLGISHILTYAISGIPLYIGTYFIAMSSSIVAGLGLDKSVLQGLLFSAVCTLPMFMGFAIFYQINTDLSLDGVLIRVVSAGFFEELFFRGFLFGLLYKYTRLGFIPAVFFGALYFGLLHLYQSTEPMELLGIFLITFIGAIIFSWLYLEWTYNIWIPVFIHMMMNLSWELFDVSENALGGVYANVFRLVTIVLILLLTILYKRKRGERLQINKTSLWWKSN
ncbi:hypothetical protein GCM10009117_10060 [Gangjinia marincola]|uniref:CAAX prenyl protease 2/Lysostaphin resistance protein A-like domain-containing protein n=1 Tax=Gangjinia marincola TaxID=578463 RepID=A0ABP3XU27_9FLAO